MLSYTVARSGPSHRQLSSQSSTASKSSHMSWLLVENLEDQCRRNDILRHNHQDNLAQKRLDEVTARLDHTVKYPMVVVVLLILDQCLLHTHMHMWEHRHSHH